MIFHFIVVNIQSRMPNEWGICWTMEEEEKMDVDSYDQVKILNSNKNNKNKI